MKIRNITVGILVVCNGTQTLHAETSNVTGSLARDRIVTTGLQYLPQATGQAFNLHERASTLRAAEKNIGSTGLSKAIAIHNIATAKNGFDLEITKSVTLLVEVPLALTGPVGAAAGGVFKMTVDKMVADVVEKRQQQVNAVLRSGIRNLSAQQLDQLKQENGNGEATNQFQTYIREAVELSGNASTEQKELINTQIMGLVATTSAETLKEQRQLALGLGDLTAVTRAAVDELQNINEGLSKLDADMRGVKVEVSQTKNKIDELQWGTLTSAEEKAIFLRRGGLATLDPQKRLELLDKVNLQAKIETVNQKFDQANKVLGGLHFIAKTLIKDENAARVISQVSDAAQKGQALFNTFAAFAAGGPIGGLMAMGSLSSAFGGGSDPLGGLGPELEKINASLAEINQKLDLVIDLQKQTLETLSVVNRKLDDLHDKVADLDRKVSDSTAAILGATWKGVYSNCRGLALVLRQGEGSIAIPYQQADEYQRYHFLDSSRLGVVAGADGRKCFEGLDELSQQPNSIRLISDDSAAVWQGKTGAIDLTRPEKFKNVRLELNRQFKRVTKSEGDSDLLIESALIQLTRPAIELGQMLQRTEKIGQTVLAVNQRPCWWRSSEGTAAQKEQCKWAEPQANGEGFGLLKGLKYGHPWRTTEFMDYVLSFYPQPFLPVVGQLPTTSNALAQAVDAALNDNSKLSKARNLLLRSLRLTDTAIAHEALLEGDLIAPMLANELLTPTAGDGIGVDKTCSVKWGSLPAGIAAPANAFLFENPRIAHLVLRLVLYHLIFGADAAPSLLSQRATTYEWLRNNAPGAWTSPTFVGAGLSPFVNTADHVMATEWWLPWIDLRKTSIASGLKIPPETGIVGESVTRGWELHYAPSDGSTTTVMKVVKGEGSDACGGYLLTPTQVQLPKGWSISAGGLIMALPSSKELINQTVEYNAPLTALLQRRAGLHAELFSLVDKSIVGIENAYEYRLLVQAKDALK